MPYDKVMAKVDDLDPFDMVGFHSFFSPQTWGEDYPTLFNTLASFRGFRFPHLEPTESGYKVEIKAPGIKKEDLKIEVVGHESLVVCANVPTKQGEKKVENGKKAEKAANQSNQNVTIQESSFVSLWEEISLPEDAAIEKMSAKLLDGSIMVDIPKNADKAADGQGKPEKKGAPTIDPKLDEDVKKRMAHIEQLREELDKEWKAVLEAEGKIAEQKAKDRLLLAVQ